MAELTIRLRVNPETGKKDVIISLRSDEDSLPHEHEQQHRQLVQKLIERGTLDEEELGSLIIEREEKENIPNLTEEEQPQDERRAEPQS